MPYVARGDDGEIARLYDSPQPDAIEYVEHDDPEAKRFLEKSAHLSGPRTTLESSDFDMARVVEDLIDVLLRKGVIEAADLPPAALAKINRRKAARRQLLAMVDPDSKEPF